MTINGGIHMAFVSIYTVCRLGRWRSKENYLIKNGSTSYAFDFKQAFDEKGEMCVVTKV